ncbi:MAG: hypothetical protein ACLQU3_02635 [Limisphaerales bacterium]
MRLLPIMPFPRLRATALRDALFLASALLAASPSSGMNWRWSNPTPHGNDILDMAWNGYLSVQVCDNGQVYTGTDFLGWVPQNSGTTNDLEAVTFFGNRVIIVGANGTVGYSDDGVNFTTTNLNTANWLVGVAASSNLVVAVGDNAVIYTSADGANWHYQGQAPNNNGAWLFSVAWGAGVFVATGEQGYVATSTNGTSWTSRTGSVPSTQDLTCVSYVSNAAGAFPDTGFYAVSYQSQAFYSTNNGSTWTAVSVPSNTNLFWSVTANNTSGLVAGDSEVYLGTSASTWRKQSDPLLTQGSPAPVWPYYVAAWDSTNGAYRLGGDDGMMVEGSPTNSSEYAWQMQYDSPRNLLWAVTFAGGLYVAVGEHAAIMTSDNGGEWSLETLPQTNSVSISNTVFLCVGGSTNLLIAAGTSGSLAVSPNAFVTVVLTNVDGTLSTNQARALGVIWSSLPAPTANDLAAICTFSNSFFLAGAGATMLRSANGTNWTTVSVPAAAGTDLSGLAASTNLIVAVGDKGLILTSPDGSTWTQRASGTTNGLLRVHCLDGLFLAVGENGTILKSTDGVSWSSPLSSGTTNWLTDAVMVTNTCYIVGNNGTVLASTDLVNWTNAGCITYQSLYSAATHNGQLVVVGLQGTILRSQIVPNLTSPVFFYDYAQSSGDNIFYVAGNPDQQFTLDSSTNLIDWTTGPLLDLIYGDGTLTFITSLGTNPPPNQFYRATLVP